MTRFPIRALGAGLALLLASGLFAQEAHDFAQMRGALTEAIEKTVNRVREASGDRPIDRRVIEAMRKVPRHEFAPPQLRPYAYLDQPLPVGPDATISQPSLVALMTDLLEIKHGDKVLEVGVGGGYHTAILAEMTPRVFSIEFHAVAAKQARGTLERLGYKGIRIEVGDGYYGWRTHAPYDAILVRMAIPEVTSALLAQITPGGRLIAPVGPVEGPQALTLFRKAPDGGVTQTGIMPVLFRPLPGGVRL